MTTCERCNDTGSLSKNLWGDLDCAYCPLADKRREIESYVNDRTENYTEQQLAWAMHQRGKAACEAEVTALVDAARSMWGWAIQIGEQFDKHPDNDKTREDWRRQCDVVQALLKNYPRKA